MPRRARMYIEGLPYDVVQRDINRRPAPCLPDAPAPRGWRGPRLASTPFMP